LVLHSNQLKLGSIVRGPAFDMIRLTVGIAPVAVIRLLKTGVETKSHCFGPTLSGRSNRKLEPSPIRTTAVPRLSSLMRGVIMWPNDNIGHPKLFMGGEDGAARCFAAAPWLGGWLIYSNSNVSVVIRTLTLWQLAA